MCTPQFAKLALPDAAQVDSTRCCTVDASDRERCGPQCATVIILSEDSLIVSDVILFDSGGTRVRNIASSEWWPPWKLSIGGRLFSLAGGTQTTVPTAGKLPSGEVSAKVVLVNPSVEVSIQTPKMSWKSRETRAFKDAVSPKTAK